MGNFSYINLADKKKISNFALAIEDIEIFFHKAKVKNWRCFSSGGRASD